METFNITHACGQKHYNADVHVLHLPFGFETTETLDFFFLSPQRDREIDRY